MTKKYTINDLPLFSPWPARLLGLEPFPQKHRNKEDALREFEKEKWGSLLREIENKNATVLDASEIFNGHKEVLYYDHGVFKKSDAFDVHKKYIKMACHIILSFIGKDDPVIEFGSGYGAIILSLAKKLRSKKNPIIAGEFTKSGMKIIRALSRNEGLNVVTEECDISGNPIMKIPLPENAIIFTSSTAYIIPSLPEDFVKNILHFKPKVVIHIEPIYDHSNTNDLYGLLRRKYIEVNDYNRNLLSILREAEENGLIQIVKNDPLVFGDNPLFCYSIIAWRPVKR